MSQFKKFIHYKKAFTLAEVLITLGIIGVVAALTIPILVQNADERATITALKKAYSTLSQAYNIAVQDNGTPDTWSIVQTNAGGAPMLTTLIPYLKVDLSCPSLVLGCFPPVTYNYLSSGSYGMINNSDFTKARLYDGTLISSSYAISSSCGSSYGNTVSLQNVCGWYFVDINGYKGPNQFGRDTFVFYLTKYGIVPAGTPQDTSRTFSSECKDKTTADGWGCTAWVIYNENMDYLHCNTLGWGIKTTCN